MHSTSTGLITESFSQTDFQINLEGKKRKNKLTVHLKSGNFSDGSAGVGTGSTTRWALSQRHDVVPTSLASAAMTFQSLIFVHKFPAILLWTACTNKSGLLFHFYTLHCLIFLPMNVITDKSAQKVMAITCTVGGETKDKIVFLLSVFLMTVKKASEISWMNLGIPFLAEIIISWLIILYLNSLCLQLPWTSIALPIFLSIRSLGFCLPGQQYTHSGQCLGLTLDCITSGFLLCARDRRSGYMFVLAAL